MNLKGISTTGKDVRETIVVKHLTMADSDSQTNLSLGGIFDRIWNKLSYWYFQWELLTCMYVMDPAEKVIITTVLLAVLGILIYAGLTYIPSQLEVLWK